MGHPPPWLNKNLVSAEPPDAVSDSIESCFLGDVIACKLFCGCKLAWWQEQFESALNGLMLHPTIASPDVWFMSFLASSHVAVG
jgi:hypothetical protein